MTKLVVNTGGVVLCGGRSSRMGRPKANLPFGDEALLQRVVRVLRGVLHPIVVVAAADQKLPALDAGILIVRDDRPHRGPLNGLAAGLSALNGRTEAAFLTSCDVPFLDGDVIRRVLDRLGEADICLPEIGGYRHPLAAAYRVHLLPTVRELLAAGHLRLGQLTERAPTRILTEADFDDPDRVRRALQNVNTPADYDAALRDAGYVAGG